MNRAAAWVAVAAVVLFTVVAVAELALRALGRTAPPGVVPDAQLGWVARPVPGPLSSRVAALHKPEGVYRIAVLGDSHSDPLLPERLQACGLAGGKRIEVIELGVPGYSSAQASVVLESRAMRYQPDLVLLQSSADDVRNDSFALAEEKLRPFFMLEPDGSLRIDESFAHSPAFRRRTSFPAQFVRLVAERSRLLHFSFIQEARAAPMVSPVPETLLEEARRITQGIIARMRDYAVRNGALFVVLPAGAERLCAPSS